MPNLVTVLLNLNKTMEYEHIVHPFGPLYNKESKILILGSLPSPKSREQGFFYGHPQNRFWPLIAELFGEERPQNIEQKRELALRHGIAMWDTIYSCDIKGASDSSIKNVVPTDLQRVLDEADIKCIFCNGKTSGKYFEKYQEKILGRKAVVLPSTSPANAAWGMEKLKEQWKIILEY